LTAFHQEIVVGIPTRATLVRRRSSDESLKGERISDVERETLAALTSRSRFTFLNRFYLRLFLLRLRFRYRVIEVPLQETISTHLLAFNILQEKQLVKKHKTVYSDSDSCISDSWRIVRFNLEVAAAELSETIARIEKNSERDETEAALGISEIEQLALGALERAGDKLLGVQAPFDELAAELLQQIDQEYETNLVLIRQDLAQAGSLRVRLRWAKTSLARSLRRWRTRAMTLAEKAYKFGLLFGKERYYEAEEIAMKVAPSLGLSAPSDESLLKLSDLPTDEDLAGKIRHFPPIYRRLFSSVPLLTKEFLVGRDDELELLLRSVRRWRNGRPCSVVIVGPEGSGKSSLLNCFANEIASGTVLEKREIEVRLSNQEEIFRLLEEWFLIQESCQSVTDLVEHLLQQPKQIVLVEGGHNLMLRTIGGGKAAETFFSIILGTRSHFLWVLSVRQYPWQRMQYQLKANQYFTHEIRTLFHDERELYEALMVRQRASGFRITYSDEGLNNRRITKLRLRNALESDVVQKELEREYFKSLFELSGGNLEAALSYWLLSLSYQEQDKAIRVAPCVTLDYRFLRSFDSQLLFTLAELMNHGGMTPAEHSRIFRLESSKSQLLLDYLVEIRLVDCTSFDDRKEPSLYVVNPIVIHPVASILESMNILY
jgi:hypothetical protein